MKKPKRKHTRNMYFGPLLSDTPEENIPKKMFERSKKLEKYPHLEIRWYLKRGKLEKRSMFLGIKIGKKDWWKIEDFIVDYFYEMKDGSIVGPKKPRNMRNKKRR